MGLDFQGATIHYDATNPGARDYLWNKAKKNYYDMGIRVFWLDEAEPDYMFHYDFDSFRYHKGPAMKVSNFYPVLTEQNTPTILLSAFKHSSISFFIARIDKVECDLQWHPHCYQGFSLL